MFHPSFSAAVPSRNPLAAYRQVSIDTRVMDASPHELVAMLFDGLLESLARARGAVQAGDMPTRTHALWKAARIVEEGLKAGLDLQGGGELARNLRDLYDYVSQRLMLANLRGDAAAIDECIRLVTPLQQAWREIAPGR